MRTLDFSGPIELAGPVVTVGSFDGVHIGHRAVLERVKNLACERGGTSVVVTFEPHPRRVIDPGGAPPILTTFDEKRERIGRAGVDVLAVVSFTDKVRALSPDAFVETYIGAWLRAKAVVVGYDHGFGKGRSGGLDTLSRLGVSLGFDVASVPPTLVGGEPVSSTRVRPLIEAGDVSAASALLGGGYPIRGKVVEGDRRGRMLGFPTANLHVPDPGKLLPPDGVYAAVAEGGGRHHAVVNLGVRPTIGGSGRRLEAHLLDFDGDLYGKEIELDLFARLRGEIVFPSLDALARQIKADVIVARDVLSKRP